MFLGCLGSTGCRSQDLNWFGLQTSAYTSIYEYAMYRRLLRPVSIARYDILIVHTKNDVRRPVTAKGHPLNVNDGKHAIDLASTIVTWFAGLFNLVSGYFPAGRVLPYVSPNLYLCLSETGGKTTQAPLTLLPPVISYTYACSVHIRG